MLFEINNQTEIKIRQVLIRRVIEKAQKELKALRGKRISVAMVSAQRMRKLNKKYCGLDKVASILSFSAGSDKFIGPKKEKKYLGEIILAPEVILSQSARLKTNFQNEMSYTLLHGLLHLLGFSHDTERKASKMEAWENKIIRRITKT